MDRENYTTVAETVTVPTGTAAYFPSLSWGAIIGGTVAAIGIQILLSVLGVGAGMAAFSPLADSEPGKHFSEGAAIIWTVCALISLFFGSLIAGRFSRSLHSGFVHGILVWCLSLILTIILVSMGTGLVLGAAFKVVGEGLAAGGKSVASGMGEVVKQGEKRGSDQLDSFLSEATQSIPTNTAPATMTRARREVGFAVGKLFTPGGDGMAGTNRAGVIKALTESTQMSEADATRMVDEWTTSYKELQADIASVKARAEQKAKEAAEETAKTLATVGTWVFFALLIGLVVSAGGGVLGSDHAMRRTEKMNRVPVGRVPQPAS